MWGTRGRSGRAGRRERFIPTHVGNTPLLRYSYPAGSVHPHACGEHSQGIDNVPDFIRFIPTHVGNTNRQRKARFGGPVHPHACGEHHPDTLAIARAVGSSPRMWGTLGSRLRHLPAARFIPTHVGNTAVALAGAGAASVHPHACGEHIHGPELTGRRNGSSPRMWGTPICVEQRLFPCRFIPTHVGNTISSIFRAAVMTVHPHACGEHRSGTKSAPSPAGSSPRMWGTPT